MSAAYAYGRLVEALRQASRRLAEEVSAGMRDQARHGSRRPLTPEEREQISVRRYHARIALERHEARAFLTKEVARARGELGLPEEGAP